MTEEKKEILATCTTGGTQWNLYKDSSGFNLESVEKDISLVPQQVGIFGALAALVRSLLSYRLMQSNQIENLNQDIDREKFLTDFAIRASAVTRAPGRGDGLDDLTFQRDEWKALALNLREAVSKWRHKSMKWEKEVGLRQGRLNEMIEWRSRVTAACSVEGGLLYQAVPLTIKANLLEISALRVEVDTLKKEVEGLKLQKLDLLRRTAGSWCSLHLNDTDVEGCARCLEIEVKKFHKLKDFLEEID